MLCLLLKSCLHRLKILCRLKMTLQACVVLLQIYLDEESVTVFGRSFQGRSLIILKNGIYKYLNNKLIKQNYLFFLFSFLCSITKLKLRSAVHHILSFSLNLGIILSLDSEAGYSGLWLCGRKNQNYCKKGD